MKLRLICENSQLNSKIWDDAENLYPDIEEKLLAIAKDFQERHYLPDEAVEDITITGSLANYNWNEHSDIDLHIIVDFSKVEDNLELLKDYYKVAKHLWNTGHKIDVCGHEVEVYVQNSGEEHHSTGVYSITNREWITKPKADASTKPPQSAVQDKANSIVAEIDEIEELIGSDNEEVLDRSEKLKDRIKKMRKTGLESGGEYSVENLAFKFLRNEGHLARLSELVKNAYDLEHSVDNCKNTGPQESLVVKLSKVFD